MPRPEPAILEVVKSEYVTKNMFRVTFRGEGVEKLDGDQSGGYFKLRIPPREPEGKTNVRTYTIRYQNAHTLDIDFALHGEGGAGFATQWALDAKPGDTLEVGGPGPAKPLPSEQGAFIIVGDMTALPAIGVNLDALPDDARGHAIIEIQHEDDKQSFDLPDGVQIHWLLNPHPGSNNQLLSNYVRALVWPKNFGYAWVACEFESMRQLRALFRDEKGLGPDQLYISSYWKRGLVEDDHRTVKGDDARTQGN